MKVFTRLLIAALVWLQVGFHLDIAAAATCFWVGGAGTYSTSNTASWASGTGGVSGTCAATGGIPKQSVDTATFDALSGGGVVVFDTTLNGMSIGSIIGSLFTGTLDLDTNDPSITFVLGNFNLSGVGVRKILLGSGTFTYTGNNANMFDLTTTTNLDGTSTFNAATHIFNAPSSINQQIFAGGSKAHGTLQVVGRTNGSQVSITGTNSFVAVTYSGEGNFVFPNGVTTTVTTLNMQGTSTSAPLLITSVSGTAVATVAATSATIANAGLSRMTFTNSTNATSSYDFGGNNMGSGGSILPPTGGGGRCIGC